jgi:DNA excision repair protein ERCC-3
MSRRVSRRDEDEDYEEEIERPRGGAFKRTLSDDDEYGPVKGPPSKKKRPRGVGGPSRQMGREEDAEVRVVDNSYLKLKNDYMSRPIWVTSDSVIILEAFSPIYQQTYDFLVAIAEPEARPEFIHQYRLTQNSLYAAVAIAIDTDTIIKVLDKLCKTELPIETIQFIRDSTRTFGKARLVLKNNKYNVESHFPEVLLELLKHVDIKKARDKAADEALSKNEEVSLFEESAALQEDVGNTGYKSIIDVDDEGDLQVQGDRKNVSFQVSREYVQIVKQCALQGYAPYIASYPLIEEYDFRNDSHNPSLSIDLRPSTRIRVLTPHSSTSL